MIDENIRLLKLLEPTSNSLFSAKKSIKSRMNYFDDLNDIGETFLEKNVIDPLDVSIGTLSTNIYNLLLGIPVYIDFLQDIKVLNIYDCSKLLIEIKDINRFKNFSHLLSYSGFSPKKSGNQTLYQHLIKIGNKLKNNQMYSVMYSVYLDNYRNEDPFADKETIENRATRKMIKSFLKRLYKVWKFQW